MIYDITTTDCTHTFVRTNKFEKNEPVYCALCGQFRTVDTCTKGGYYISCMECPFTRRKAHHLTALYTLREHQKNTRHILTMEHRGMKETFSPVTPTKEQLLADKPPF